MKPIRHQYDRLPAETRSKIRSLIPGRLLRWYAHQKTDVYLLSYPKCGRTWLRLMLGKAMATYFSLPDREDILFLRTNRKIHPQAPSIAVVHDDSPMLKSPSELEVSKKRYRHNKVIFLVRDPRDVVISSYYEINKRGHLFGENPHEPKPQVFEGKLIDFIRNRVGSFDTILAYYKIWAENQNVPEGFLLVRYEDMKANPHVELCRVLEFIGLSGVPDEMVAEAVDYASFENMRKMELENRYQTGILNPADPSDPGSFKTRKGKIEGYRDYLSLEEIEELNIKMTKELHPMYGYTF